MPTRSDAVKGQGGEEQRADWAARTDKPRRSVFGNYHPEQPSDSPPAAPGSRRKENESLEKKRHVANELGPALQTRIDTAMARVFLYQFIARAFSDPATESWAWLTDAGTRDAFLSAVHAFVSDGSVRFQTSAAKLFARLQRARFEPFQIAYVAAFGHAARGDCPLNEIEYGDLNADPLFQPHRLADLAAFYRAFGLEVADGAAERPDHIGMELEFMGVLAAKESFALEYQLDKDQSEVCADAQKKFLREHLARWSPGFARRLARVAKEDTLVALAEFLRDFMTAECARFGVIAGSEDLLLRPVDDAAESLCAACGLQNLPPGASATGSSI